METYKMTAEQLDNLITELYCYEERLTAEFRKNPNKFWLKEEIENVQFEIGKYEKAYAKGNYKED